MARAKRQSTPSPKWTALQAKLLFPEQEQYEIARPCLVDEQPIRERAREVGKDPKTVRRIVQQFVQFGIPGLVPTTGHRLDDGRVLPLEIRQHIVLLKAEYPALTAHEIATICDLKFERAGHHRTVQHVLDTEPVPKLKGRRFLRHQDEPDAEQRRHHIIQLHIEGWTPTSIAGYLAVSRPTIYSTLRRWANEGVWGLADKSHARKGPRTVTLGLQNIVRQLQDNPELGEFRMHAALKQQFGIEVSPRTCGRIIALNRAIYGLPAPVKTPRGPLPMPFAASERHAFWSVDLRYVEHHRCHDHQGYAYVITIWDNYSRDILASGMFRSQDLTAYLMVLRDALLRWGAPAALVSDHGSIFLAQHAQHIYQTLGIRKVEIDRRQSWQNYAETLFNTNRRMADHAYAQAESWEELCRVHAKYITDYQEQEHNAHRNRPDGRRSPAEVLGWVRGRELEPAQIDDAFTLRFTRRLDRHGNLSLHHWKLYVEAGLPRAVTDIWFNNDKDLLTVAHAQTPLAQYQVTLDPATEHLQTVRELRFFATTYHPPQLLLWDLTEMEWFPARHLTVPPNRPRSQRRYHQATLPLHS